MEVDTNGGPVELVPMALLAYELGLTRDEAEARFAGLVERDDLGLACVPGPVVRRVIADRDAAVARQREEVRRRDAAHAAAWRPPRGVSPVDDLSAVESMMAAAAAAGEKRAFDTGRISPHQEFLDNLGRPAQ